MDTGQIVYLRQTRSNADCNLWVQFATITYLLGLREETARWALIVLNASAVGVQVDGIVDETLTTGTVANQGSDISSIAASLNQIANMEPVSSFNHGDAVYSIEPVGVGAKKGEKRRCRERILSSCTKYLAQLD